MAREIAIIAVGGVLTAGLLAGQVPQTASGVISGVVTDELNRPVPSVTVTAFRLAPSGELPAQQSGESAIWPRGQMQKQTNDLGEFRLWPLEAGEYVVAVVASRFTSHVDESEGACAPPPYPGEPLGFVPAVRADPVEWLTDASRRHLVRIAPGLTPREGSPGERGYVTTYSPRATELTGARRVMLADKQVEAGVDLQLQLRPAVRVTGRIIGVQSPGRLDVGLTSGIGGARTRTAADGSFVFLNVPVGSYSLVSPGTTSGCDYTGLLGPSYQGRADITIERGDQNHFNFTVGLQTSAQRGPTLVPAFDRLANAGAVAGVVTTDDGEPLDRARVRVTSSALPKGATAVSGRDGRFVIDNLPPDVFTLTVSHAGFVDQIYGQHRRGGEGTLIQLGAGERIEANVTMTRPGVIAGIVRDERGMPMPGVTVSGRGALWTETDDRGRYRLWPVPAGNHTVRVSQGRTATAFKGYLPTYHPGVTDADAASNVRVDPGEVQVIDIEARPATAGAGASLTVRIRNADGWVGTGAGVYVSGLIQSHQRAVPATQDMPPTELVATFASLPAGKHYVSVNPEGSWSGSAEVVTDGRTPATVNIVMTNHPTVSLVAAFDGQAEKASHFQWTLFAVTDSVAWNSPTPFIVRGSSLDATWRSTLTDLRPGRYVLHIQPEGAWIATSARLDGWEVLDRPFRLETGSTAELAVTFTSRRTSLQGVVRDAAGSIAAAADILIFSVDRHFWTPGSRRIRLLRPRSDGRFDVSGLPPGDYAVVAEQQIDPDDVGPAWLQSRLPGSARVTLIEGQPQSLSVRVREK